MSSSTSSSSSRRRRFHVRRHPPVVVDIGCSCRKPKLFSFMHNYLPLSIGNNKSLTGGSSNKTRSESSTTCTTTITNSTFSPCNDDSTSTSTSSSSYAGHGRSPKNNNNNNNNNNYKKKAMVAEESVAVEKVSSDPYVDFKESMLQMIVEKEIYQWEELRELLNLFLSLNSPYHHHLILRAFAEIWEGLFSPAAPPARSQQA